MPIFVVRTPGLESKPYQYIGLPVVLLHRICVLMNQLLNFLLMIVVVLRSRRIDVKQI